MIRLSNGHCFEYATASGALAYDGRGWLWEKPLVWSGLLRPELFTNITKTITLSPRRGNVRWHNPFACVRFLPGGVVNAVGLSNPGLDWWLDRVALSANRQKAPLIASVHFESKPQMIEIAARLNLVDLAGVEVNARCPNIQSPYWQRGEAIVRNCREFKKYLRHPLLLKLSIDDRAEQILPKLENTVEAVSVNSVRWEKMFPGGGVSPLADLGGGGVSGKITQPLVWPFIERAARLSAIPVIASAVWDFEDLARVRSLGAKAVAFGSVFMLHPWRPTAFVKKDKAAGSH